MRNGMVGFQIAGGTASSFSLMCAKSEAPTTETSLMILRSVNACASGGPVFPLSSTASQSAEAAASAWPVRSEGSNAAKGDELHDSRNARPGSSDDGLKCEASRSAGM